MIRPTTTASLPSPRARENGHGEVVKLPLAHIGKEEQTKKAEDEKEEVGTPKKRAMRVCEKCGKEAEKMKKCSVCKLVRYCSEECQLEDWKKHKKKCKLPEPRKGEGRAG